MYVFNTESDAKKSDDVDVVRMFKVRSKQPLLKISPSLTGVTKALRAVK